MRSALRTIASLLALASCGCSSLGGIELGDDGPDRFPEDDDDGYGPSSPAPDPTDGTEPADEDGGSSSESGAPPDTIDHGASEGGSSSSEGGSEDNGEGTGDDPASGGGTTDASETTSGSGEPEGTGTDEAGTNAPCADLELPACPPACDRYDESPCGLACDVGIDEGHVCGDEYGAGMTCTGGVWVCFDPPPAEGECAMVCDPT